MSLSNEPKSKKCRAPGCGQRFKPIMSTQRVCSVACAIAISKDSKLQKIAAKAITKQARRDLQERRERLKTRAEYAREAQAAINRYVRLRDAQLGCISCDKPASWQGQWHCSHFRSVGAAPHLRFNLWNMNKSCSACNNFLSGNIMVYRPALIEKIGQAKVDWLECNSDIVRHYIPYLKRVKAVFSKKARRIEKRLEEVCYG